MGMTKAEEKAKAKAEEKAAKEKAALEKKEAKDKADAEKVKTVKMVRSPDQSDGGAITADVSPEEVGNWEKQGWRTKKKAPPKDEE